MYTQYSKKIVSGRGVGLKFIFTKGQKKLKKCVYILLSIKLLSMFYFDGESACRKIRLWSF